jgi:hypothetical protein
MSGKKTNIKRKNVDENVIFKIDENSTYEGKKKCLK